MGLRQQFDKVGSSRDYGPFVQIGMGTVIVLLDLVHVHCFGDPSHLVDLATVVQQRRRIRHRTGVAFEVDRVDFVEANQGYEQPDVREGEAVAGDEAAARQCLLEPIERCG